MARGPRNQAGISLIGLLIIIAVVGFFALIAFKTVPTYTEYRGIVNDAKRSVKEGGDNPQSIKNSFDRYAVIDDITSIQGKDLTVSKSTAGGWNAKFAYSVHIPLFMDNVSLQIDYSGSTDSL